MERDTKSTPWWKPALVVFGQVSGWIVVPLVLALSIGKYLDGRFDTTPWIFIGASALGFLVSSFGIVRVAFAYMRDITKEDGKSTEPQ